MKNKFFRFYISYLFECVALYINARYYLWALLYKRKQAKLANRYQVHSVQPEVYGARHIEKMKSLEREDTFYIYTSGTSKTPKMILADKKECIIFN